MRLSKAAERLGVDEATVMQWAQLGELEMTGYFAEYYITDESVAKFAKAVDRYNARKHERTRRKDRDKVLPDYYVRLDVVADKLRMPVHQVRVLANKHAFDARKANGWWVMDGGLVDLFVEEHKGKEYKTAAKVLTKLKVGRTKG